MKVYELAKELGMSGKELVEKCKSVGMDLKGNTAPVDEKQARMVRAMFPPLSPEELARRTAAERAHKAKAKPKAKEKKVAKKKVTTKKIVRKKVTKTSAAGVVEEPPAAVAVAEESAEAVAPREAPRAKKDKKDKKKPKQKKPREAGTEPVIQFQFVGEADPTSVVAGELVRSAEAEAVEAAAARPDEAVVAAEDAARAHVEEFMVGRRWERLDARPVRVRSALAEAESRYGSRARRGGRSRRRQRASGRVTQRQVVERPKGEIEITAPVTVRKLAEKMALRTSVLMARLLEQGCVAAINDVLPEETAQLLALEFDVDLKIRRERDLEEELTDLLQRTGAGAGRVPRAPVVTFLGHVDHGKTSLLDKIRTTDFAAGEAGGITQHIGASMIPFGSGSVTFIDTPGHEAFTEMRARGAHVTDMVVLVVAADDGVMPQTEEAISHARAAGVPIVVALNKMDLPNANPMRAKQQLAGLGLASEEWGGKTGVVECSAQTGKGVEAILERIALEAEILELRASPEVPAHGFVLDARVEEGRGIVASTLVRDGTLRRGDVILSSHSYGRVRGIFDQYGRAIADAGPSMPVEVTGLSDLPEAGDKFYVLDDLERARAVAEKRTQEAREASRAAPKHVTLETLTQHLGAGEAAELRVILKADVKGTLEAIVPQLADLGGDEAHVDIIHQGVGSVNASDVLLADASDGICLGFSVEVDAAARQLAELRGVQIKLHSVIYELIDEVTQGLEGELAPERREVVTGHAEVRQVFRISRLGTIAGSYVLDGTIERGNRARVTREGAQVFEGTIAGLKRFQDDAREVREGFECGIRLEGFDARVGDRIEAYRIDEVARTLS